jgi:hypothetical protein
LLNQKQTLAQMTCTKDNFIAIFILSSKAKGMPDIKKLKLLVF